MRVLGIAALLVALALAGCTEAPAAGSAKSSLDEADDIAAAWHPRAELVAVLGGEDAGFADANGGGRTCQTLLPGGDIEDFGDGKSPLWAYLYRAGNDGYSFTIDTEGQVACENEGDWGEAMSLDRSSWRIDSDDVAEILHAEIDGYDAVLDQAWFVGYWLIPATETDLELAPDDPVWVVFMESSSGADLAHFAVDANSGEVLDTELLNPPASIGAGEFGRFSGSTPLLGGAVAELIPLTLQASYLQVEVEKQALLPLGSLDVRLIDPDGNVRGRTSGGGSFGISVLFVENPAVGTWTVEMESQLLDPTSYTGFWCTDEACN